MAGCRKRFCDDVVDNRQARLLIEILTKY